MFCKWFTYLIIISLNLNLINTNIKSKNWVLHVWLLRYHIKINKYFKNLLFPTNEFAITFKWLLICNYIECSYNWKVATTWFQIYTIVYATSLELMVQINNKIDDFSSK